MGANIFSKKHWRKLQHFPDRILCWRFSPDRTFKILHFSACTNAAIAFKHIKSTTMSFWVFTVKTIVRFYYSAGFIRIEFTGFFPQFSVFFRTMPLDRLENLHQTKMNDIEFVFIFLSASISTSARTRQTHSIDSICYNSSSCQEQGTELIHPNWIELK